MKTCKEPGCQVEPTFIATNKTPTELREWDGEFYKSVFPSHEAEYCQCHTTIDDAVDWIIEAVGSVRITVLPKD